MVLQLIKSRDSLSASGCCVRGWVFFVALTVKTCYRYQNADWRLRPLPEEMLRYKCLLFLPCSFLTLVVHLCLSFFIFEDAKYSIVLFFPLVVFAWMHLTIFIVKLKN